MFMVSLGLVALYLWKFFFKEWYSGTLEMAFF